MYRKNGMGQMPLIFIGTREHVGRHEVIKQHINGGSRDASLKSPFFRVVRTRMSCYSGAGEKVEKVVEGNALPGF
jgi:hypothetical protein